MVITTLVLIFITSFSTKKEFSNFKNKQVKETQAYFKDNLEFKYL